MGYYEMQVCWNLVFSILNCIKIRANQLEQYLNQKIYIPQTLWKTYNLQFSYFIIGMKVGSNQCFVVFDF